MSYESNSILPKGASEKAISHFLGLLGYVRLARHPLTTPPNVREFSWYSEEDYESRTGIYLTLSKLDGGGWSLYTKTNSARSFHDLQHQNLTIREIRSRFGGYFETDEGRNRCFSTQDSRILTPSARGVVMAYSRFMLSLAKTKIYRSAINVSPHQRQISGVEWADEYNPVIVANNLLLPFLTAILEDFFKSTFIALLRYSERKETFFKNAKISSSNLAAISEGRLSVEAALAETFSFQRVSSICEHFKTLDSSLDIAGCLKKPYRKRKVSLFQSIELMVEKRHAIIHRNTLATDYLDSCVEFDVHNLEVAAWRCMKRMNSHYKWAISDSELRDP